jgi:large subunit ribosomal protein L11
MPSPKRVAATVKLQLAAGLAKGSGRPGADGPIATLDRDRVRQIARTKLPELTTTGLDTAERIIAGTARSMGIQLVDPGASGGRGG